MNIDLIIKNQRLTIDREYESFATLFCNVEGPKKYKTKERFVLSNWFEGYLYTVLLGIKLKSREKRIGKIGDKSQWSDYYIKQYKYVLSTLLVKKDILMEIKLLSREQISSNYEGVKSTMSQLRRICDEYSYGGLKYLKDQYDKNNKLFNDHDSLKQIIEKVIEENQ